MLCSCQSGIQAHQEVRSHSVELSGRDDRIGVAPSSRTRPACGDGPTQHRCKDSPTEVEDPDARMGSSISVDENPFGMQFGKLSDNY
jgi:hypothetical protein